MRRKYRIYWSAEGLKARCGDEEHLLFAGIPPAAALVDVEVLAVARFAHERAWMYNKGKRILVVWEQR